MTRLTLLAALLAVCGVVGWRRMNQYRDCRCAVCLDDKPVPGGWRDLERVDAV